MYKIRCASTSKCSVFCKILQTKRKTLFFRLDVFGRQCRKRLWF